MSATAARPSPETTVVVATQNRLESLLETLARLVSLPEDPDVIVVDNASTDGSPQTVRERFPQVRVVELQHNLGAAARNVGVARAGSEVVAFSDDDSWWAPGALGRAAELLHSHPTMAVLAARIHVEPGGRLDPTCERMASSPIDSEAELPGPAVLGFVACGAVVRRSAFLEAGGFDHRLGLGGEENLLALDLASAGWDLAYVDEVVAHHRPAASRDVALGRRRRIRNTLWMTWLRRSAGVAARHTLPVAARAPKDAEARAALREAVGGLPWIVAERAPVQSRIDGWLRRLGW